MSLVKSASRFIHILSASFLSGSAILNYLFNTSATLSSEPSYAKVSAIAGISIFVSGIANIFLIKAGKKLTKE